MTDAQPQNIPDVTCHCGAAMTPRAKGNVEADIFYIAHVCDAHCCGLRPVSLVARRWNAQDDSIEGDLSRVGGIA